MPGKAQEIAAARIREEIMDLLRQQVEALDSPQGLSDERLSECYQRQERVQELREKLQALAGLEGDKGLSQCEASNSMETTPSAAQPPAASADAVIGI